MLRKNSLILEKLATYFFMSLCFAILTFFAIWSVQPSEIVSTEVGNTIKYLYFGLAIGIIIGFFLVYFLIEYQKLSYFLELIFNLLTICAGILLLGVYALSVKDNWEWWITQTGWFFRQNGLSIGIFLGIVAIYLILSTTKMMININQMEKKDQKMQIVILIGLYFLNIAIFNEIFQPYGLFHVLIYAINTGTVCFGIKFVFYLKHNRQKMDNSINPNIIFDSYSIPSIDSDRLSPSDELDESNKSNQLIENNQLNNLHLEPDLIKKRFMKNPYFKIFMIAIIAQIIMLILTPFVEYPASEANQIVLPVFGGSLFISFWSIATKYKRTKIWKEPPKYKSDSMFETFKNSPLESIKEQAGIFWIFLFQLIRVILPIFLISSLWYGFRTLFDLPDFQKELAIWGMIGSIIYYAARKQKIMLYLLYFIIIGTFIILIFFLNSDIVNNAYTFYGVDYELIYPFQILLSPYHAIIVGIGSGFIICFELNCLFTKYIDKSNITLRAVLLSFTPFLIGLLVMFTGIYNVPGGSIGRNIYPPSDDFVANPFLEEKYLIVFIAALVAIFIILLTDFIIPKIFEMIQSKDQKKVNKWINPIISRTNNTRELQGNRKQVIALCVLAVIVIPGALFLSIPKIKDGFGLPLIASNNAVDVFIAPSNIRVSEDQFIVPENSEKLSYYNVSLARNEYESFQLILNPNARSLNGLRYSVSDFQLNETEAIESSNIEVRYAESVYDTMPEKLVPFSMMHIIEQRNHILWITAYAPYSTKPGSYLGTFNFTYGNNEFFALNVSLDVWNFTMPDQRHMRSNFGPKVAETDVMQTFFDHRINSYGIPMYRAWSIEELNTDEEKTYYYNDTSGNWIFNWTYYDSQLQYLIDNDQNGFYINCPLGMPRDPVWVNNNDVNNISTWGNHTGKFYEGLQAHLDDLLVNQSKNWFNYVYVYFIDEFSMFVPDDLTKAQYWDLLEVYLNIIKTAAPDVKIMTTTPPSAELEQLNPYIDIYCPVTYHYNETEWNAAKADGKEMWMYACVGPKAPWPNSHTYNRLFEIRVLYWQTWYYHLDGFLYWSTMPYYHGKYGYGYNGWGDAWYLYNEGENELYDTIRWENWRDAAEDYEYLWLMNKTVELKGSLSEDSALLNSIVNSVTGATYEYCDSGKVVQNCRTQIGNWISEQLETASFDLEAISELDWNP